MRSVLAALCLLEVAQAQNRPECLPEQPSPSEGARDKQVHRERTGAVLVPLICALYSALHRARCRAFSRHGEHTVMQGFKDWAWQPLLLMLFRTLGVEHSTCPTSVPSCRCVHAHYEMRRRLDPRSRLFD